MNIIISLILFIFPTKLARLLLLFSKKVKISPQSKIGFSWIAVREICIVNGKVGHFNYLKINRLQIVEGGKIGHFNYISGDFDMILKRQSKVDNVNKFSSIGKAYHRVLLLLNENSHITTMHLFDLTDSISIGNNTTIAGAGTQIWTHSFLRSKELQKNVRVDAPVFIGDWCYIGSRSIILSGVNIADEVAVGAQAVVSRSLNQSGLYVGQGLKYVEIDFKDRMLKLGRPIQAPNIYRK